jgi:hypothetical protein
MLLLPTDLLGPRGATDMSGLRQEDAALAYLIDRAHQYSPWTRSFTGNSTTSRTRSNG